ncbi:MAG: hypothetical protein FJX61_09925 [Alphaproteobacteria bacterium]|nr:hypothetical protein [Alphaproteobacteria bacterium]
MTELADVLLTPPTPAKPRLALFGRFVGSWDLDVTWYADGIPNRTATGEWHFGYVLGGHAIQDVWIVPTRAELAAGRPLYEYGSTIRFPEPGSDDWRSTWHGPVRGLVIPFLARAVGDEIVLEGRDAAGAALRWVFSAITRDSFRWRNLKKNRDAWVLEQDFAARRR